MHLGNHHPETLKKSGLLLTTLAGYRVHRGLAVRSGVQRKTERTNLGFYIYWNRGYGAQGLMCSLFIGEFKT